MLDLASTERFDVRRKLGAGAMGVVYEVFDKRRGGLVALKTLGKMLPASIYRFKQEFRALADVSHPNLVALHELFVDPGAIYFTMDLVEGKAFGDHLRDDPSGVGFDATVGAAGASLEPALVITRDEPERSSIDAERLRASMRQLAEGVAALHAAGKLHRDLKPSNVLVTESGVVKILDFGLVSDATRGRMESTREGAILGTPAYMSPEQSAGKKARPASDWYALGVMLYEALTGKLPFEGSVWQILIDKQRIDPPPARSLVAGVPADLDALASALLRRDPDDRPEASAILAALGGDAANLGQRTSDKFIGRASELRALEDAFDIAASGRATLATVAGSSGMGKSAVLRRFIDDLPADVVVLAGRCHERESMPFKAFDAIIDGLTHYLCVLPIEEAIRLVPPYAIDLARVFPVLRRFEPLSEPSQRAAADAGEHLVRAERALREILKRLAKRSPVVMAIDDLQWGDADSARLLEAILAPPDPPAMLVVAAAREEAFGGRAWLRDLDARAAPRVRLGPLGEDDARALAVAMLDAHDEGSMARAAAVAREANGVPFFVAELARFGGSGATELSLDEVVGARIERLHAEARRVLATIAVAGRPIARKVLFEATRGDRPADALGVLRAATLVRTQGAGDDDEVECYHDRIREVAVASLVPTALASLHGSLARALEAASSDVDAEILAEHYRAAGELERAARFASEAADAAVAALAFHRAAQIHRLEIELEIALRGESARVDRLRARLGDALARCGHGSEAAKELLAAARSASPAASIDLRRRAAEQLLVSGHFDEGLAVLDDVLRAVDVKPPEGPTRTLLSFLAKAAELRVRGVRFKERPESAIDPEDARRLDVCFSAASGLSFTDPIRGADFQARHLLLALKAGEPSRVALGLANYAAHLSTEGVPSTKRVNDLLAVASDIAERLDHPHARGRVMMARGTASFLSGRFPEARAILDEVGPYLRANCTGVTFELDGIEQWARLALVMQGDYVELERRCDAELRDAELRGDRLAEGWMRACGVPYAFLRRDDPVAARASIARAIGPWSERAFQPMHFMALWHEVLCDLYEGEPRAARARIDERWSLAERSMLLRIQILRVQMHWNRALAAIGMGDVATGERDARAIAKEDVGYAQAVAAMLRGALAPDDARRERAFEEAIAAFEAVAMPHLAAAARLRLAELNGDADARAAAEAFFAARSVASPSRFANLFIPPLPRSK